MAAELDLLIRYLAELPPASDERLPRSIPARVAEMQAMLARVQRYLMDQVDDDDAQYVVRYKTAAELDELGAIIERLKPDYERLLPSAPPQVRTAFRHVDVDQAVAGLAALADWLRKPTPESTQRVEAMMVSLREIGVTNDWATPDIERERDAEISANVAAASSQLHAEVASSLEDLFPVPADDPKLS
jgi:hypothetical protein